MSKRSGALVCAPLTILVTLLSTGATAEVPAQDARPGPCDATIPEGGERLMRKLKIKVDATTVESERVVLVKLMNHGKAPALGTQLTLVNAKGQPILPALFSDNCVTVLPGEPITVTVRYSTELGESAAIRVRGWNFKPASARIPGEPSPQPYLQPWQQPVVTTPAPTVKSATVTLPTKR